jgi:hypothetical protein
VSVAKHRAGAVPLLFAAAVPALAAAAPTISVSELGKCAAIIAVDQRLACYDSLALAKIPPPTPAAGVKAPASATVAAGSAASRSESAVAAAVPTAGAFGMATHAAPVEQSVQSITARVVSADADRQGNVFVTLDNGQTWTYLDAGGPPQAGAEMTIRRASLGSYLITTPFHRSFRAQRTK